MEAERRMRLREIAGIWWSVLVFVLYIGACVAFLLAATGQWPS